MEVLKSHKYLLLVGVLAVVETTAFVANMNMLLVNLLVAFLLVCMALVSIFVKYGYRECFHQVRIHPVKSLFAIGAVFAFLGISFIDVYMGDTPLVSQYILLIQLLMVPAALFGILGIFVWKWECWKLFLLLGGSFGLSLMLMLPIGAVPDEPAHMQSAYHVSNVLLGISGDVDGTLMMRGDDAAYQMVDYGISQYGDSLHYNQYLLDMIKPLQDETLVALESVPMVRPYFPYYISAVGITIGRVLHLGTYPTLLLGRLLNLCLYLCLCTFALKKMKIGRLPMLGIMLMPMSIQQGMSYSYDVLVHGLSFVLIAYTTCVIVSQKLTRVDYGIMAVCGLVLWPLKSHAYFLLCLLPWLFILRKKLNWSHEKKEKMWKWFFLFVLFVIAGMCIWQVTGARNYQYTPKILGYSAGIGEEGYSISYFIAHPLQLFVIFAKTLGKMYMFYPVTFVGQQLAWINLPLPEIITIYYLIVLFFLSIRRFGEKESICLDDKRVLLLVCLLTTFFIMMGMLLGWSPVKDGFIQGVQGRYFIPFAGLFLMCISSDQLQIHRNLDSYIVLFLMSGAFIGLQWITLHM